MAKMQIAAQLYTVRDLTEKDFAATLKQVATIGFAGVELAGYGNLKSAGEMRKALDDTGLNAVGSHTALGAFEKDINKVMDDNEAIGNKNLILPWIGDDLRNKAGYERVAAALTSFGEAAAPRGFNVAYHNHSFEFETFDGRTGLDIIYGTTDPKLVKAELDCYWVVHGRHDAVATVNKLANRLILVHLKDMDRSDRDKFAPVGTGRIDYKPIIAAAEKAGVAWGIVEQDNCYGTPPLDALRTSYEGLRKIGAV